MYYHLCFAVVAVEIFGVHELACRFDVVAGMPAYAEYQQAGRRRRTAVV